MMRPALLTILVLAAAGLAAPARANPAGCGGNSYSFAEVVEAPRRPQKDAMPLRPHRGGPIEVQPSSLCPDIIEDRAPAIGSVDVMVEPPQRRR